MLVAIPFPTNSRLKFADIDESQNSSDKHQEISLTRQ